MLEFKLIDIFNISITLTNTINLTLIDKLVKLINVLKKCGKLG